VYAYSVFKNPLMEQFGWDNKQVTVSFTLAIFFLGLSAAAFGRFVEKYGPRKSAMVAAVLFSCGMLGTGLAVQLGSLAGYYLCYGVIGGIGLGIGYISPVSTLVKWFPDRRGLATGMAVMGFGAGSLICSPVAARLIDGVGVANTFYLLGAVYFVLMMSGALYIARPPEGWMPKGMREKQSADGGKKVPEDLAQLTAVEALRTGRFWMLWLMMFVNISSGIMIISVASPMAQDKVGMSVAAAAAMVGIMGLFNGGGRIGWAALSDYWGRTNVFTIFFASQLVLFLILPGITNAIVFEACILFIMTCYGGGFASLPAYIGDLFGTKQLGAIHGFLLKAWSAAGVVGPMLVASLYDSSQNYDTTFYVFAVLLAVALATTVLIRLNIRKIRAAKAAVQSAGA